MKWKPKLTSGGRYAVPGEGPNVPAAPRSILDGGPRPPSYVGAWPWKGPIPRGSVCEIVKGNFNWHGCEWLVGRFCTTKSF